MFDHFHLKGPQDQTLTFFAFKTASGLESAFDSTKYKMISGSAYGSKMLQKPSVTLPNPLTQPSFKGFTIAPIVWDDFICTTPTKEESLTRQLCLTIDPGESSCSFVIHIGIARTQAVEHLLCFFTSMNSFNVPGNRCVFASFCSPFESFASYLHRHVKFSTNPKHPQK